jgi:large subunit ribosomal protein L14
MSVLVGSKIRVIDNSGAIVAECIELYKASHYKGADVGDIITVTLKRVTPNRKLKKGELFKAMVVRSKTNFVRYSGHRFQANNTAVVLLNKSLLPRAKRARSLMLEEIRRRNDESSAKVLAIAPIIL